MDGDLDRVCVTLPFLVLDSQRKGIDTNGLVIEVYSRFSQRSKPRAEQIVSVHSGRFFVLLHLWDL